MTLAAGRSTAMFKRALPLVIAIVLLVAAPSKATTVGIATWDVDFIDPSGSTFIIENFAAFDFLGVNVSVDLASAGANLDLLLGDISSGGQAQTLDFLETSDIVSSTVSFLLPGGVKGTLS